MNGNGIIYKFDSLLRPRLHNAFELHRMATSEGIYQSELRFSPDTVNSPNETVVELSFGDLWTSILVDRRKDVERRKDPRYSEIQCSKR